MTRCVRKVVSILYRTTKERNLTREGFSKEEGHHRFHPERNRIPLTPSGQRSEDLYGMEQT